MARFVIHVIGFYEVSFIVITFYYLVQSSLGFTSSSFNYQIINQKKKKKNTLQSKLQLKSLTKTQSSILSLFNSQEQKEKKKYLPRPSFFFFIFENQLIKRDKLETTQYMND